MSITVSTLGVGANSITAVYSGDGNGAAATSAASQVLVLPTSLASTVVNDPVNQASPSPLTDERLVLPCDTAGLVYVSGAANPSPIVFADATISPSYNNGSVNVPLSGWRSRAGTSTATAT